MLHILLVILKILGIILACLLGLLLLLVLIVLVVPIRYRVDAKWREEIIIKMRVSWLARIVFIRLWFINKQLHIKLRIFGFTFWDNLRPKKEKKVKKKKTKAAKRKKPKKEKSSKKDNPERTTSVSLAKDKQELVISKPDESEEKQDIKKESVNADTEKIEDLPSRLEQTRDKSEELNEESEKTEGKEKNKKTYDFDENVVKKETGKLKKLFAKIKGFFQKISKIKTSIVEKWNKLLDLIKKIFEKKNLVSVFLKDELNMAGIKIALGQLLEVLKYCGPQKVEGYVKFGTGDPESTGKLLGAAAFLYGYYGKSVTIEPDFENKVFEAEGMVKGRIRIIRLLIIGIKVIRDKNFKKLVKNARQLKEEL